MDLKFSEGPCGFDQVHVLEKILMPINEHKEHSWNKVDNDKEFSHQETVYFTVSSVLQSLRTKVKNDGIIPLEMGYIIRQLDPLFFDRFNEGVIQASVLRTAKSRELDYSADDTNSGIIGSLIERMLQSPDTEDSTGLSEILLALVTKKLQVKKDYLLGLDDNTLDREKHAMTWMLAEYAKDLLLKNNVAVDVVSF